MRKAIASRRSLWAHGPLSKTVALPAIVSSRMVKPTQKSSCGKNAVSRNLSNSGMARKKDTSTIVVILTGDTRRFAEAIARKLGIDWVRAKLAREEKSQRLRICRRRPEDRYGGRWGQRRCALAQG